MPDDSRRACMAGCWRCAIASTRRRLTRIHSVAPCDGLEVANTPDNSNDWPRKETASNCAQAAPNVQCARQLRPDAIAHLHQTARRLAPQSVGHQYHRQPRTSLESLPSHARCTTDSAPATIASVRFSSVTRRNLRSGATLASIACAARPCAGCDIQPAGLGNSWQRGCRSRATNAVAG